MTRILRNARIAAFAAAALGMSAFAHAQDPYHDSLEAPVAADERGISIALDNDLFAGSGRDADYSWGASVTIGHSGSRATQVGILAMTPRDITVPDAQLDDRPYSNLLYFTRSQMYLYGGRTNRARFTSYTLGILGLPVAEGVQKVIHEGLGGDNPQGWDHQISNGGEPTARYVHAEQWLLGNRDRSEAVRPEVKVTLGGSVGYLTEGSAAISMRWGRIRTPWWTFNPELGDYSVAPIAPVTGFGRDAAPEVYGFVGARVKARAYNAFLQGQFRSSDVTVAGNDVERIQGEAWAGVATNWSEWRATYSVHVASREISPEPAARTLVWASVSVARAF
jgi:hypothetical protein